MPISPLLSFIRCMTPDQKKDFVAKCGKAGKLWEQK